MENTHTYISNGRLLWWSTLTNVNSCLLLVSCQHPHLDVSPLESSYTLRNTLCVMV